MIGAIQLQNKRVGSTFLQQAIDSHPEVIGIDEVFVNVARRQNIRKSGFVPFVNCDIDDPGEYIIEVISNTYPDKNLIFKLMYNQVYYHDGLVEFIKDRNIPMIHVMRKNIVKQVVSFLKMAEYNHNPISITPHEFYTLVENADFENKFMINEFKNNIKLTLYYEDMIGETIEDKTYLSNNANIAVCDFFKVPQFQLYARTKKKNKEDIGVYLPNIGDIKSIFRRTKYEWMLEEK
jgi:hypothetical protein